MPNIGPMELIVVLVLALLVLGPKRLPDAGRSLGAGIRGFKDSLTGITGPDEPASAARPQAVVAAAPVAPAPLQAAPVTAQPQAALTQVDHR